MSLQELKQNIPKGFHILSEVSYKIGDVLILQHSKRRSNLQIIFENQEYAFHFYYEIDINKDLTLIGEDIANKLNDILKDQAIAEYNFIKEIGKHVH